MNIPASAEPSAFKQAYAWYQTVLMVWYGCRGFRYASQSIEPYGIEAKFTDVVFRDVGDERAKSDLAFVLGIRNRFGRAAELTSALFGDGTEYDLVNTDSGVHLADTDNNRRLLEDMLHASFPGSTIADFTAQACDGGKHVLRFRVLIPFEALYAWAESMCERED